MSIQKTISKSDIINEVAKTLDREPTEIKLILDEILSEIIGTLLEKDEIMIRGFGRFYLDGPKTKRFYNVNTKKVDESMTKATVRFTASGKLKRTLAFSNKT